jgi:hypothetical protein
MIRSAHDADTMPDIERTCRTAALWFGQEVVWLVPQPAGPFRALTRAVAAAFPDYPPYDGYDERVSCWPLAG